MEITILVVSLCVFVLTLLALLFLYRSQQTFQKEFRSDRRARYQNCAASWRTAYSPPFPDSAA
jgi:hypothetical protein